MTSILDTLITLIDIPSVTGDEGRLCTAISERLLSACGRDAVDRLGNNLIAGRRTGRPLLLVVGHLDTVPVQGDPSARVDGDRVFGLGSSDMKGGLAVMVHLLEDSAVQAGPYDVIGVFYEREEGRADENGLEDVLRAMDWLSEAEFAVVLEPTDLQLQVGCTGMMNARATFHGKAAHSARPWLGDNAISKAGALLTRLHEREPEPVEVAGLEFREVVSVTTGQGGIANNVVPAQFDLNVNYRFSPMLELAEAEQRLREILADADDVVVIDAAAGAVPPEANPHLARLENASAASRAAKQAWTDVARLSDHGIPAVNFGPGEAEQAHQANESAPIESLERAYGMLREFLVSEG